MIVGVYITRCEDSIIHYSLEVCGVKWLLKPNVLTLTLEQFRGTCAYGENSTWVGESSELEMINLPCEIRGACLEEDLVRASLSTPIQGFHHEKKATFYPDSFDSSRVRFNTL